MDTASLLALVRFRAWANERVRTTADGLSGEEFRGPAPPDHGTQHRSELDLIDAPELL